MTDWKENEWGMMLPVERPRMNEDEWVRQSNAVLDAKRDQLLYANTGPATVTAGEIYMQVKRLQEELKQFDHQSEQPAINWETLSVRQSDMAVRPSSSPRKIHIRRWFHTKRYHLQEQKKLVEKYGYAPEPCVYFVNPAALHAHRYSRFDYEQPYLIVHPTLYKMVCEIIYKQDLESLRSIVNRFDHSTREKTT